MEEGVTYKIETEDTWLGIAGLMNTSYVVGIMRALQILPQWLNEFSQL